MVGCGKLLKEMHDVTLASHVQRLVLVDEGEQGATSGEICLEDEENW